MSILEGSKDFKYTKEIMYQDLKWEKKKMAGVLQMTPLLL